MRKAEPENNITKKPTQMKTTTPTEINTGNTKIARFMGYEYIGNNASFEDYGWWKVGTFKDGSSSNNPNFLCVCDAAMDYHYELNSLVPVVRKIKSLEKDFPIESDDVVTKFMWEDIKIVWAEEVKFIDIYNEIMKK